MRKNWLIVAAVAAAVLLSPCGAAAAEKAAEKAAKTDKAAEMAAEKADEQRRAIIMKTQRRPAAFFSVFNFGYAGDNMPKEPERFEKLVKRISEEGRYNAILCKYTDERAAICKKYGVKMMVDLLVAGNHVFKQPKLCEALCRKLRGNSVVLAYHIWSDRFGSRGEGRRRDIRNVHEWDPTHPTYVGTYRADGMAFLAESDFISYYDFHWKRGPHKNFSHLLTAWRIAKTNDGRIGRFVSTDPAFGKTGAGNIARHRYTLNTSIACGLKGCLWFVGSRTMNAKTLEWKGLGLDVNKVLAEIMPLRDEIPKLGNPVAIYSTPITRTLKNRPVPGESAMPPGLQQHKFPGDFWIRPAGGEFVMGVFKYANGGDAVFVANHNAYAEQDVKLKLPGEVKASLFDRKEGKWRPLERADGVVGFKLAAGGGELLRLDGRADEEKKEKEEKKDAAPAK